MPDFTELDSSLIASYWIYFIASFIIGFIIGALVSRLFFQREDRAIKQEKKNFEEKIKELEKMKILLSEKDKELEKLKSEVAKNELFWNEQKQKAQEPPGDKALFNTLHKTGRKKD